MWKKKQVVSLMLGMSMTMSNVLPALPANAAQDVPLNGQTAEGMMENGDEGEELQRASASNASRATASNATMSNALLVNDKKSIDTHIATFVGEIPQVDGVDWEDGVSEEDFSEAYSTVTVKSTEGTSYTVEVIPKNLLYFIDNGAGDTTPPFEAIAALTDTLKNDKADGKWDESAGWGYTYSGNSIGTKKLNAGDESDKTQSGIYGDNVVNTPLEYHFVLEAGTYTITSEHKDWWNMVRPMSMTVSYGDTVLDAGSVQGTGTINYTFTLTEAQTVTYSINNTGKEAAIVSWIAVEEVDPFEMVTVSFDTQGGSEIEDMAVMPGSKLTAPSNPTKEGFAFKGWYQDAECTKSWNFSKDTVPEEGLTLFAKWGEAEALEDQGLVTARKGASLQNDFGDGKMLVISEGWIDGKNSSANGGGVIENAANYFKTSEFTWYTDFSFNSVNNERDDTSALLLGNSENHFRLIPRKLDKSAVLRVKAGENETDIILDTQLDITTWHSVAVLYEEDDTQGYVTLVADGETMTENAALGFKLSEQEDLIAGFGITYNTGYMRDGKYDNIVVKSSSVDVETAAAETKARVNDKNSQKQNVTRIVIDGSEVEWAADNMNGLTFKGFGVLDCNSTNSLLLDYKAQNPEKYWEMLELLFGGENPIMQHVKIEMGNDKNNSTGSQACTMRTADEYPDVSRVTGFQLAADAKKINPDVKVSLLYWETPGWVNGKWENLYKWIKNTILAANREYGYMVDMVSPGKNESADDVNYLKKFHEWLVNDTEGMISNDSSVAGFREGEAEQLHEVQIIMSDEVSIPSAAGSQMTGDEALREAVDIVGYHYNTDDDSAGSFKRLAEEFDKEIWNSEAQATFGSTADRPNNNMVDGGDPGTGIGGAGSPLEMANTIIKGFVNSRRTHFIYQPTFGAFYEGTQYNYKDVMAARDPWSGYVNYDGALNIMEHFSKFAVTGWEYDTPDENVVWRALPGASMSEATGTNPVNGRNGGQMYMTLAAPDKSNFSVIISNDSAKTKEYRISPKDLNLPEGAELEVWETREADEGDIYNANYMKCVEHLTANPDGSYDLTVKPWSIVTVTSLDMDEKEEELAFPTATEDGRYVLDTDESGKQQDTTDNYLYADDFDYENMPNITSYENGEIVESDESFIESRGGKDGFYPLYTQDTNGTFEVVMDESGNGVLKMTGQTGGGRWNGGEPATILGDYRWMNYKVSVDFNLNSTSESLLLGARQRGAAGGGDNKVSMSAYNIALNRNGEWVFRRYSSEIAKGTVSVKDAENCNVALKVAGDTVTVYIEGNEIYSYKDSNPQLEGRIMLGVGLPGAAWTAGEFDNLKVETVPGYTPYFTMVHDNLHMKEWDGDKAGEQTLVYEGSWSHVNQKGSNYSQRSYSETSSVGASVSYTFDGTGFALIGPNGGSAKVNVDVDGERMYTDMATIQTESHQPYLVVRGLTDGEHTVTVSLASGKLGVDSIAYLSKNEMASSHLTLDALRAVMDTMENLNEEEYDADSWKDYQEALTAASSSRWTLEVVNSILADPVGYGVDQEVINEITDSYQALLDKLLKKDAPVEILDSLPKMTAVLVGEDIEDLGDVLPKTVKVRNADGTENDAAEITWKLSGDTKTAYDTLTAVGTVTGGKNLTASVQIEVLPANLLYFIDTGTTDNSVYDVYKTLAPELKNETNDKKAEDASSWGRKGDYSVRGISNAMDKGDTGVWNDGGDIVYQLPLEAGIYTLSAGFKQWWGSGENRELNQSISYTLADGTTKTVSGDKVSVSGSTVTSATSFILSEDTVVTYTVSKAGNKAPVLSWLGVAKAGAVEEESWSPIFSSNEDNQWAGLLKNGTVTTKDDEEQGEVIHMNAAGTTYIQLDPDAVDLTGREYMTMSFNLKSETAAGNFFTVAIGQNDQKYMFLRTRENDTYTTITKGSYGAEQGATANVETLNKWVKVDLVFTPEQIVTYMDGVAVSTVNKTILMTDLGANPIVYLGKSFYSGDKYFAGAFDNIEIYNRARSAEEISLAYTIEQAEKKVEANYTEESWEVFAKALAEAMAVAEDSKAEQETVDAVVKALTEAMDALKEKEVEPEVPEEADKTALNAKIAEAESKSEDAYTVESWEVFAKALAEAKVVAEDSKAEQETVDAAVKTLTEAMDALKEKEVEPEVPEEADKTALNAKIAEAESKSEEAYTAESWEVFAKALAEAKVVAEDSKAEQGTVDAAVKTLTEAMDALKEKEVEPEKPEEADKTALNAKIAEAESKSEEAYTAESWEVFAKALAEARAVLADEEVVQADVNAAVKTLISAMDALKEKEVEPEEPEEDDSDRRPSHSYGGSSNAQTVINATGSTIGVTSKLTGNVASTIRSGAWKKLPGGNWNLVKENGSTAKNEWAYLNDKTWYLFDNDGKMVQGWANVNNTWYYMDTVNGDMKTGWQSINGKWYYLDATNGDMKTGWQLINGKWYYLDAVNGDMKTGRVEVNGVWYNLNTDGSWME